MPRKPKSPEVPQGEIQVPNKRRYICPPDALWGGFINIRLNDNQREAFYEWEAANAAHIGGYHEDHLGEGIKSSFAYDEENQAFICTYTGRLVDMVQSRYSVSSRAGTITQALSLAVYKHEVLAEGDYIRFSGSVKEFLQFG